MRCQRCGREINPLRQLTDRSFCSESCKKRGARASASAVRDFEFADDLYWESLQIEKAKPQQKNGSAVLALIVFALVAVLTAVRFYGPEQVAGGNSPLAVAAIDTKPNTAGDEQNRNHSRGGWTQWLQQHLPGDKPIYARSDFSRNLADWVGTGANWRVTDGAIHPSRLRLWRPTLASRDYEWQFRGEIQKKAISWAFRAKDTQNYYAMKILVSRPGEVNGASIVRYGVGGAQLFGRLELPLPVMLHRDRPYDFTLLVAGNRFTTLLDGHVIDEWQDKRLASGGVGFFSDEGESAAVEWSEFRERKGWFSSWRTATFLIAPPFGM